MGDYTGGACCSAHSRTHLDGCVIFSMEEVVQRSFLFPTTSGRPLEWGGIWAGTVAGGS